VHEMFHVFQSTFAEQNWGNTFALVDFLHTPREIALLMAERNVMAEYLKGGDARSCFGKILDLRALRESKAGKDIILIDKSLETAEGMAFYVEICAAARVRGTVPMIPQKQLAALTNFNAEMLTKYRAGAYAPGAILCLMADELFPDWHSDWAKSGEHIYDWLASRVISKDLEIAEGIVTSFYSEKKHKIDEFMASSPTVFRDDVKILSLDPMNIICHENICLHLRSAMLKIGADERLFNVPVAHEYGDSIWDIKSVYVPTHNKEGV